MPVPPTLVTVPPPAGADQVPSPRKNVELLGVPVTALFNAVTLLIIVPLVGRVTEVLAVAVIVVEYAPDKVRLPPIVIVLAPLLTPVPPYVGPIMPPFHVPDAIVPTVVRLDDPASGLAPTVL